MIDYDFPIEETVLPCKAFPTIDSWLADKSIPSSLSLEIIAPFKIIYLNIRSLRQNFNELTLAVCNANIDIIFLSEINIDSNLSSLFQINGYRSLYKCAPNRLYHGLAAFIKNKINFKEITVNFNVINLEYIMLDIKFKNVSFNIISLYRPHSFQKDNFISDLEKLILEVDNKANLIILGDTNLDLFKQNDQFVQLYESMLLSYGCKKGISIVTREELRQNLLTQTCIDHLFLRLLSSNFSSNTGVINVKISDHYIVGCKIRYNPQIKSNQDKEEFKTIIDRKKRSSILKQSEWNSCLLFFSPNLVYDKIKLNFDRALNQSKKIIRIKNKKSNNFKNNWMTEELYNKLKMRDVLFRRTKSNPSNSEYKNEYQSFRNKLNKEITHAKRNYIIKNFNDSKNDIRKKWKCINGILGRSSDVSDDRVLNSFSNKFSTPDQICSAFADSFIKNIRNTSHSCPLILDDSVAVPPNVNFYLRKATVQDIKQIVNNMDKNKSPGFDGVGVLDFHILDDYLYIPLCHLINLSISKGIFPDSMKISIVKPIYKSGARDNFNNFRPISKLSVPEKIFEKYLFTHLNKYLLQNNILSNSQYGFQKGKSTESLLVNFTNKINNLLNDRYHVLALFIDYSKAFDTLDHKILLRELSNIGITGNVLKLFKSYLTDRYFMVNLGGNHSGLHKNDDFGVPQGSILGPILYNIYVNSISSVISHGEVLMYADDTVLIVGHRDLKTAQQLIQLDYNRILRWSHDRHLIVNRKKTVLMHFKSPHLRCNEIPTVSSHDCHCLYSNAFLTCKCPPLDLVNSTRYLGIIIDCSLRWNPHIDHIAKRLQALNAKIYYLHRNITPDCLYLIYKSLMEPIVRYGIETWGSAANYLLKRIERIQLRTLNCITTRIPVFNIDPNNLQNIYIFYHTLSPRNFYFYKLITLFKCNFQYRFLAPAAPYNLRFPLIFLVPRFNNVYGKRSLHYVLPYLFNRLPQNIRDYTKKDIMMYLNINANTLNL